MPRPRAISDSLSTTTPPNCVGTKRVRVCTLVGTKRVRVCECTCLLIASAFPACPDHAQEAALVGSGHGQAHTFKKTQKKPHNVIAGRKQFYSKIHCASKLESGSPPHHSGESGQANPGANPGARTWFSGWETLSACDASDSVRHFSLTRRIALADTSSLVALIPCPPFVQRSQHSAPCGQNAFEVLARGHDCALGEMVRRGGLDASARAGRAPSGVHASTRSLFCARFSAHARAQARVCAGANARAPRCFRGVQE